MLALLGSFWSGNLFLIAPFPDLCLLVPFFFLNISIYDSYMSRLFEPEKAAAFTSFSTNYI